MYLLIKTNKGTVKVYCLKCHLSEADFNLGDTMGNQSLDITVLWSATTMVNVYIWAQNYWLEFVID